MSIQLSLIIALLMLAGNAFFVGAEFGLISARRSNIELKALTGSKSAKITLYAMEHVSLMLAGAQLGVTVCSLVLGAVGEPLFAHVFEPLFEHIGLSPHWLHAVSFASALLVMVYLHVVIGEMVPKNLALANPSKTALLLTPPLVIFVKITRPLVSGLNSIANTCLRIAGVKPPKELPSAFTRDEVSDFVDESKEQGLITADEGSLLSGALRFDEKTMASVLLPISSLVAVSHDVTPQDFEKMITQTGYSRFPVVSATNELLGYIHLKDILDLPEDAYTKPIPSTLFRPLVSIRIGTTLRSALALMQRSSAHLAKVTDGSRGTVGVVALEDLLEEFVGEIRDDSTKSNRQPKNSEQQ